jgi:hypothetical protein
MAIGPMPNYQARTAVSKAAMKRSARSHTGRFLAYHMVRTFGKVVRPAKRQHDAETIQAVSS